MPRACRMADCQPLTCSSAVTTVMANSDAGCSPIRRATKTEWSEVASGTIARIALASRPDDRLGLVFSENRSERYEIVIENGDGPPLEIKGVRAEGNTYRLMILASNGNPRRVVYGSGSAEAPSYDTKAVLAASRPDLIPAPLFLGPEVEDPRYQLTGPSFWSKLLKGPTGLSAAIVVMVAVLAWVLLRVGRQLNKLPIEDI